MSFQLTSFLLGIAAGWVLPVVTRAFRPLAIEATAAGMGVLEEARRVIAEQMEAMEDIAAEARARRDEALAGSSEEAESSANETEGRPRRRERAGGRRRTS